MRSTAGSPPGHGKRRMSPSPVFYICLSMQGYPTHGLNLKTRKKGGYTPPLTVELWQYRYFNRAISPCVGSGFRWDKDVDFVAVDCSASVSGNSIAVAFNVYF